MPVYFCWYSNATLECEENVTAFAVISQLTSPDNVTTQDYESFETV